uniref:Uncharacterized protein n=1 Tax=Clastoptera arizonana TaxID=38151 RepID=A0A1B6CZN9_9HEMI
MGREGCSVLRILPHERGIVLGIVEGRGVLPHERGPVLGIGLSRGILLHHRGISSRSWSSLWNWIKSGHPSPPSWHFLTIVVQFVELDKVGASFSTSVASPHDRGPVFELDKVGASFSTSMAFPHDRGPVCGIG